MTMHAVWIRGLGWGLFVLLVLGGALPAKPAQVPLPDLIVTEIRLNPMLPSANDVATLEVFIENAGPGPAGPARLALRINGLFFSLKPSPPLGPGQGAWVTFSWRVIRGKQTLEAQANAFGDIEELELNNNFFEQALEFTPDLVVTEVALDPPYPLPGQLAQLRVTVSNVGGQPTQARAAVRVKDGRGTIGTLFASPLAPGQSEALTLAWRPESGERLLRVEVDAFELIPESDELNNALVKVADISPVRPTGADLMVERVWSVPEAPQPGQLATLNVLVRNVGQGPAAPSALDVELDGQPLSALEVGRLPSGQSRVFQTTWRAEAGERWVRVKADARGQIIETNEDNNATTAVWQVGSAPNACSQRIVLDADEEGLVRVAGALGLRAEEVRSRLMPEIKRLMEQDFQGVNVYLSLRPTSAPHSRVRFVGESRLGILGAAPLDFENRNPADVATVYWGSFIQLGLGQARFGLSEIAQAMANTASHEVGHFLGLIHDGDEITQHLLGQNLMAANNEAASFFQDAFFTETNRAYLEKVLPLSCGG